MFCHIAYISQNSVNYDKFGNINVLNKFSTIAYCILFEYCLCTTLWKYKFVSGVDGYEMPWLRCFKYEMD